MNKYLEQLFNQVKKDVSQLVEDYKNDGLPRGDALAVMDAFFKTIDTIKETEEELK